ncbi:hypothetical protein VNI00_018320 [Paramarasmius palmivorus]|uniref:Uncharacterized protein n=1 Tax=Paramarasmius palmivorus TaxID=297713 RepID=A0AAW0AZD6_9AGAR
MSARDPGSSPPTSQLRIANHNDILHHLEQARNIYTQLTPKAPGTPRTNEFIQRANSLVKPFIRSEAGQRKKWKKGNPPESGTSSNPRSTSSGQSTPQQPQQKQSIHTQTARQRVEELTQDIQTVPPITVHEYHEFLSYAPAYTGITHAENEALVRILRSFKCDENNQWVTAWFQSYLKRIPNLSSILAWVEEDRRHSALIQRLCEYHNTINHMDVSNNRSVLTGHILTALANLEFAVDWKRVSKEPGSRHIQKVFYHRSFLYQQTEEAFAEMSNEQIFALVEDQYQQQYTQWYRRNSHLVTSRNRLLEAYHHRKDPDGFTIPSIPTSINGKSKAKKGRTTASSSKASSSFTTPPSNPESSNSGYSSSDIDIRTLLTHEPGHSVNVSPLLEVLPTGNARLQHYIERLLLVFFGKDFTSKDTQLPSVTSLTAFIRHCATLGQLAATADGQVTWTWPTIDKLAYVTEKIISKNLNTDIGTYFKPVYDAIDTWNFAEPPQAGPDHVLSDAHYSCLMGALLSSPSISLNHIQRIWASVLSGFSFFHRIPPQLFCSNAAHLCWKDFSFVITGYDERAGLDFGCFIVLNSGRLVALRSFGSERVHLDPLLILFSHAVSNNVFEEDVPALFQKPSTIALPYQLKIRPSQLTQSIFTISAERVLEITPEIVDNWTKMASHSLGWHCDINSTVLLNGWDQRAIDKIPREHIKHLFGHYVTDIQTPLLEHRTPYDVHWLRAITDTYSCTSWTRAGNGQYQPTLSMDTLISNAVLQQSKASWNHAEQTVKERFNCTSESWSAPLLDDSVVQARDLFQNVLYAYFDLIAFHHLQSWAPLQAVHSGPSSLNQMPPPFPLDPALMPPPLVLDPALMPPPLVLDPALMLPLMPPPFPLDPALMPPNHNFHPPRHDVSRSSSRMSVHPDNILNSRSSSRMSVQCDNDTTETTGLSPQQKYPIFTNVWDVKLRIAIKSLLHGHPLLHLSDQNNGRFFVIAWFTIHAVHRQLADRKICIYCLLDPTKKHQAGTSKSGHAAQHLISCEISYLKSYLRGERCPICMAIIEVPESWITYEDIKGKRPTSTINVFDDTAVEITAHIHFQECYNKLLFKLTRER